MTAVAALSSGCQADHEPGSYVLPAGESWSEQREQAESVLARYTENLNRSGKPPKATAPSWDPSHMLPGTAILSAVADPVTSRMVVTFTGALNPATSSCGIDYFAEAVESAEAVVIIVLEQRHAYDEECTLEGTDRTATVNLARPLADRAVLDLQQSQPIPVSIAAVTR